jgi:hypothetical protein
MDAQGTDERFEIALRRLCGRWGSFDICRRVEAGDPPFKDEEIPEVVIQQPHSGGLRIRESDLPCMLKSDIDRVGAVTAIKQRLIGEPKDDISLDFAANNRLDLTIESFSLRPAWRGLFEETERRTAAERLLQLMTLTSPNELIPSPGGELSRIVDYINEQIISWETDQFLPNSQVPYGTIGPAETVDQTWCESVTDSGRAFDEVGLIRTSLKQCDHYFDCSECGRNWPQLHKPFHQFLRNTFSTCREVLNVLRVCLARAIREGGDEVSWRAIICANALLYNQSVWNVHITLSEIESGYVFGPVLQSALAGLDADHFDALFLAEAAEGLFIELQWFLFGDESLIYLPSDGDLLEVPGSVVVLNSTDLGEWKRLMAGSDLKFQKRCRDGDDMLISVDGFGLLRVLCQAANFRSQEYNSALASTTDVSRQRQRGLSAKNTFVGDQIGTDLDFESLHRTASAPEDTSILEIEPIGSAIQSLSNRVMGLSDIVTSNSAAQVPIIDTLQDILKRIDGPSRYRAEQSAREALGQAVYEWLCPSARNAVIVAEYCWLDLNFPDPSKIVEDLATAFERQLRTSLFLPFCQNLASLGVWNYPERPQISQRSSWDARTGIPEVSRKRDERELPTLFLQGRMNRNLTLGTMELLIARPLPSFREFLERQHIDAGLLSTFLPELTAKRNMAVHEGIPQLREEATDIRRRWLGQADGSSNIFAVIMP